MNKLIIIGAGGLGREVAWLVERINKVSPTWELLGFIDDNIEIQGKEFNGYKVMGTVNDACKFENTYFVCAVGNAKARKSIVERIPNAKFATLIDPTVEKSDYVEIGEGSIICLRSTMTTNVKSYTANAPFRSTRAKSRSSLTTAVVLTTTNSALRPDRVRSYRLSRGLKPLKTSLVL